MTAATVRAMNVTPSPASADVKPSLVGSCASFSWFCSEAMRKRTASMTGAGTSPSALGAAVTMARRSDCSAESRIRSSLTPLERLVPTTVEGFRGRWQASTGPSRASTVLARRVVVHAPDPIRHGFASFARECGRRPADLNDRTLDHRRSAICRSSASGILSTKTIAT